MAIGVPNSDPRNRRVGTAQADRTQAEPAVRVETFRGTGLVPETSATEAIVLSNYDMAAPVFELHHQILAGLPEGVKAYVISPVATLPWLENEFRADFRSGRFSILETQTDSIWARDFVPDSVRSADGTHRMVDFNYRGRTLADEVPRALAGALGIPRVESELTVEGGNLMTDGTGRLFVTTKVLEMNQPRSKESIESELKEKLGVTSIEWLPRLPGEPTGHVDMVCKIVDAQTVLISESEVPEQKRVLDDIVARFKQLGYTKVKRLKHAGQCTRSYTNALFVNGVAMVPTYFDKSVGPRDSRAAKNKMIQRRDDEAVKTYRSLGFKVVPIDMSPLPSHGGAVHCLTHQISKR